MAPRPGEWPRKGTSKVNNGQVKLSTLVAAALVTTTLVSSLAYAQIRYVDHDAPPLGDGLTWNTAYALQAPQQCPGGASVT